MKFKLEMIVETDSFPGCHAGDVAHKISKTLEQTGSFEIHETKTYGISETARKQFLSTLEKEGFDIPKRCHRCDKPKSTTELLALFGGVPIERESWVCPDCFYLCGKI